MLPGERAFKTPIMTRNATVLRTAPTVMQSMNHLVSVLW